MATKFKRVILNPQEVITGFHLVQLQDNVDLSFSQIQKSEFQDGVFVTVTLPSGVNTPINHGLDRKVQGWTIVNKNAQADVWAPSVTNSFPDKQIILRSSANVTVKLYIF